MKNIIYLLMTVIVVSSCKKEGCTDELAMNFSEKAKKDNGTCVYENQTGVVTVKMNHKWDNQVDFKLNTNYIHPITNDDLNFTTLKYYISNFKLQKSDGSWWSHPDSYFLVDLDKESSSTLELKNVPSGDYTAISYTLGVDSLRNVSGSQSGALSTMNGMFWSWNSGYIMVKAEGVSPNSSTGSFAYHLGGFSGNNNIVTVKTSTFSTTFKVLKNETKSVTMSVNPASLFDQYGSVSTGATVHMPGAKANLLSAGFYSGIHFESILN